VMGAVRNLRVRWWDRLLLRADGKRRRLEAARTRAMTAQQQFHEDDERWLETASLIDQENNRRYAQFVDDYDRWEEAHATHLERERRSKQRVEAMRLGYVARDASAIEQYVREVLARSRYPAYFPREASVRYVPSARAVDVSVQLIRPDDLPTTAAVTHVKFRDELKTKVLPQSRRNALYVDVVKAVCVRTLHELFESDTVDAIEHAIVSGYVVDVDPATGHDAAIVIASVHASKLTFSSLRLDRVRVAECFDGLDGRGSSRGLPKLAAIKQFDIDELVSEPSSVSEPSA